MPPRGKSRHKRVLSEDEAEEGEYEKARRMRMEENRAKMRELGFDVQEPKAADEAAGIGGSSSQGMQAFEDGPRPGPIDVAPLVAKWPGREAEVLALSQLLGEAHEPAPPLFIHGPPSTGKTSVVRDVVRASGCLWTYIECNSIASTSMLLEAILDQLQRGGAGGPEDVAWEGIEPSAAPAAAATTSAGAKAAHESYGDEHAEAGGSGRCGGGSSSGGGGSSSSGGGGSAGSGDRTAFADNAQPFHNAGTASRPGVWSGEAAMRSSSHGSSSMAKFRRPELALGQKGRRKKLRPVRCTSWDSFVSQLTAMLCGGDADVQIGDRDGVSAVSRATRGAPKLYLVFDRAEMLSEAHSLVGRGIGSGVLLHLLLLPKMLPRVFRGPGRCPFICPILVSQRETLMTEMSRAGEQLQAAANPVCLRFPNYKPPQLRVVLERVVMRSLLPAVGSVSSGEHAGQCGCGCSGGDGGRRGENDKGSLGGVGCAYRTGGCGDSRPVLLERLLERKRKVLQLLTAEVLKVLKDVTYDVSELRKAVAYIWPRCAPCWQHSSGADAAAGEATVEASVPPDFYRITRPLLRTAMDRLYQTDKSPERFDEQAVQSSASAGAALEARYSPLYRGKFGSAAAAVEAALDGGSWTGGANFKPFGAGSTFSHAGGFGGRGSSSGGHSGAASGGRSMGVSGPLHMSNPTKLVLVCAYLACHNPEASDTTFFTPKSSVGKNSSRAKKMRENAAETYGDTVRPAPLERILSMAQALQKHWSLNGSSGSGVTAKRSATAFGAEEMLQQLSSLVCLNLMARTTPYGEISEPRFVCNASRELAGAAAAELGIDLAMFLYQPS